MMHFPATTPDFIGNLSMTVVLVTIGLGLLLLTACGAWLGLRVRRIWRSARVSRRVGNALNQERLAADLLDEEGYRILASQAPAAWTVLADGIAVDIRLRADYLVERDGLRYVADAKFGALVGNLRSGATRRQLLEYLLAYDADGALLVDMRGRRIVRVEFPSLTAA